MLILKVLLVELRLLSLRNQYLKLTVLTDVNSTAYCTPQPELPHSCLPQPSSLKASIAPTADVKVDGAVSEMSTES